MDDIVSFGYWVRRRRKALDLTQGDLARRVGCAVVTIQKIESDERRPSRQVAERLADQLAISTDERPAFLQCARAELAVDRLIIPIPPIGQPAPSPTTIRPTRAAQSALPSGMVTFLFTDIEGSTPLWEHEPEQMRLALARHDAILRTAIAAHAGHAYKLIGDAFQAAFVFPMQAVAAALAAQRALAAQDWETSEPLRVRMGVHVGPAVAEGNDYSTTHTLNRVARIMSSGHGGQILLSVEVADVVRRDLPTDVTLRDLGKQRMKGLTQLEHLFQVVASDLPAAFPPLKTLDTFRTNLPAQLTSFVGREQAITDVTQLLTTSRLVTLTGPGGTGKTRLALQVAAEMLPHDSPPLLSQRERGLGGEGRFPDGVWLVELAPLADAALVPQAVATVLGLREDAGRLILATLTDFLSARNLLLIFDNCEHVLEACAQLADALLRECPNLRIQASSREALGVAGEAPFRVPSLATPDPRRLPPIETLTQYEAVRLFVERGAAVLPGFTVTEANAPALAQVCARLDGIPLALELAAARVNVLRVEQIAARLDDRFRLLTGGSRTAVPRQQTLRALIDWSYDLLAEPEQVLLQRLAVFAGGWTLEAAEVVCAGDGLDQYDVLDVLAQLVNKSLVVADREQGQETRYRLLETIRQYALERLAASGEAQAARQRHAEYFLALAEDAEPRLRGPDQRVWFDALEEEHDNLRATLTWSCTTQGDAEIGLRIAGALSRFWQVHTHYVEGLVWIEALLLQPGGMPATRAKALTMVGQMSENGGNIVRASAFLDESLALYRALEDSAGTAQALFMSGRNACWRGDYVRAETMQMESLALSREQNNTWLISWSLLSLGDVAFNQNETWRAEHYFQDARELCQRRGDKAALAWAVMNLGRVAHTKRDDVLAQAYLAQGWELFEELNERRGIASVLLDMARVVHAQGDRAQAQAYYVESLAELRVYIDAARIPECFEGLAGLASAAGQPARAAGLLGAAEALRDSYGLPLPPVYRASYERDVAAARAQLDDATFMATWAEGRAMTMEQAIEYALNVGYKASRRLCAPEVGRHLRDYLE